MKVLVTGSRNWTDRAAVMRALVECGATAIVHGDQVTLGLDRQPVAGADWHAKECARALGIRHVPYPAEWQRYGASAGPRRNQRMIDVERPALVLAFPLRDSRGTWDCVARADAASIEVRIFGGLGRLPTYTMRRVRS